MKTIWRKIRKRFTKSKNVISIILTYNIVNLVVAVAFYPLVPLILNYAPGMMEGGYDTTWMGFSYLSQYIFIVSIVIIIGFIYMIKTLKIINNWESYLEGGENESKESLLKVRKKCLDAPNLIYLFQLSIPVIVIVIIDTLLILFTDGNFVIMIKTILIFFSFGTLSALITLIFCRRIFRNILLKTYTGEKDNGIKFNLQNRIFLQILPAFLVAVIFTSLLGYSRLIEEKGKITFELYKSQLESVFEPQQDLNDTNIIVEELDKIKLIEDEASTFLITPDMEVISSDDTIQGSVFEQYIYTLADEFEGRVFDLAGETQGSIYKFVNDSGEWIVGVKYNVATNESLAFFLVSFVLLIILNVFVMFYFSKTLAEDLGIVAKSLAEIADGRNIDFDKKLAVVSSDEIGDLVVSFNKIQQREKENIDNIKEQQSIIMEQERLASLGQLIGGIAHNLKTPIMSISGGIEGTKELVNEYKLSIDNDQVTSSDHHEIADEMLIWLNKIKPHCAYMSDIISAVKGQAVTLSATTISNFTLEELIKRIDVLMKHTLVQNHCIMNKEFDVDITTNIKGELNSLVQILDNIIVNAIQSYDGKNGEIDFRMFKEGSNINVIISDKGRGISEDLKTKLFKEMITTRGKDGTGLGLYMSYSTIKGRFGGDIRFESEEGVGTTFYISIPFIDESGDNTDIDEEFEIEEDENE